MTRVVIRHGLSEANNRENVGKLAFASADAPLMNIGLEQARDAATVLGETYGMSVFGEPVATSTMLRTQQTATAMGLRRTMANARLDEVAHGIVLPFVRDLLDRKELPEAAIRNAESLLENPPAEGIWVTHGLVIAGLCKVLGVENDEWRFIPRFCEIRELPID